MVIQWNNNWHYNAIPLKAPSSPLDTIASVEHSAMPSGQSFPWEVAWFSGRHPVLQTQICLILQHFFQIYEFPVLNMTEAQAQEGALNSIKWSDAGISRVWGPVRAWENMWCSSAFGTIYPERLIPQRVQFWCEFSFLKFCFYRYRHASRIWNQTMGNPGIV